MRINPQIVEPIIALSIVYIGLENIFKKYIKEYLRYVPEHREKFRGQLAHKKKLDLAKDYEQARLKAKDQIK